MKNLEHSAVDQKLRQKFCITAGIPIKIFEQPYFDSRLKLFDTMYGAEKKFRVFLEEIAEFKTIQDYFEFCNKIIEGAVKSIRESKGFKRLNSYDMTKFETDNRGISGSDIFSTENDGETFISLDLVKANFTALKWFDNSIVGDKQTYEEFIEQFSGDYNHITKSKYIRQTILRKCNGNRQTKIERYLVGQLLIWVIFSKFEQDQIKCFKNDELIIKVTNEYTDEDYLKLYSALKEQCYLLGIEVQCQWFTLHNIKNTLFYYKKLIAGGDRKGSIELKCVDAQSIPFILRKLQGEKVTDEDLVFIHEGRLAKLMETPVFNI